MMALKNKQIGFSLIELLVVMTVMAILIGLSAFGLQQARESARDGQRKSDLETIRTALSFYRSDCNFYPTPAGGVGADFKTNFGTSFSSTCTGSTNTYIDKIPSDPLSGRNYWYYSNGTTYKICSALEAETTADTVCTVTAPVANCGTGFTCSYSVANP